MHTVKPVIVDDCAFITTEKCANQMVIMVCLLPCTSNTLTLDVPYNIPCKTDARDTTMPPNSSPVTPVAMFAIVTASAAFHTLVSLRHNLSDKIAAGIITSVSISTFFYFNFFLENCSTAKQVYFYTFIYITFIYII